MTPVKHNKDPLEMARKSLDFAAIAAVAPSSKDILFKAQTMVPLNPTKPWWKVSKWTMLSALVFAMLFAPWLPSTSSITMLKVRFEQFFDRPAAQEIVLQFVREMPEYALLGVDYGTDVDGRSHPGQFTMRVNAVNHAPQEVQERVRSVIETYSATDQPYMIHSRQVWVRRFNSPFMHVVEYFSSRSEPRHSEADPLARELLANEDVFTQGVITELNKKGFKLEKFGFLNSKSITGDLEYHFTLDSWPRPVGVSVQHFNDLTDHEQSEIRETVNDFLRNANLADTGMLLTATPQPWMPVIFQILSSDGVVDPRLSSKVQAEMIQPTDEQMRSIDFDVDLPVRDALNEVLPGCNFQIEYSQAHAPHPGGPHYLVKVTVTGHRAVLHPWVTRRD